MKEIPVVFSINNNYAQHCGVTIASILYNSKSDFYFYILHIEEITPENKMKLKKIVEKSNSKIKFITLNSNLFNSLPESKIYTNNMYSRIFFPRLHPKLKKCIYLDSDVVVNFDLNKLYNLKFKEPVGAVLDPPMIFDEKHLKANKLNENYFNSGVLLINIKKYINQNIDLKCIEFLRENKESIKYPDQDALNYALKNNWYKLDLSWNVQRSFYLTEYYNKYDSKTLNQIKLATTTPRIIHYSSVSKPWNFDYKGENKNKYYSYLKFTPWKNYKPKFSILKFLKNKTPPKIKNIIKIMVAK